MSVIPRISQKVKNMTQQFLNKFEIFCQQHQLLHNGDKIIVGCSGGSDSIALLTSIWLLKEKYDLSILVAHINYHLRGEDSNKDQEYVTNFCFERNVAILVKNVNLNSTDSGMEEKARHLRMEYFNNLQKLYNADSIALGHNKNDQTETVLFRFFRGSGFTGLRGILPKNEKKIHPLLDFTRQEIIAFLNKMGISWREDKSNYRNDYSRNKIRNFYIPQIKQDFNSNLDEQILKMTEMFTQSDEYFNNEVQNQFKKEFSYYKIKKILRFDLDRIIKLKPILKFYLYRECMKLLTKSSLDFYTKNMDEINKILMNDGSKEIYLPNKVLVRKTYNHLYFLNHSNLKNLEPNFELLIKEKVRSVKFGSFKIKIETSNKIPEKLFSESNFAYFDYDKIVFPLTVRYRKNGDKFVPYGMKHNKKLKDFFIDEKVSKFDRDNIIILQDSEKIIWVSGYRIDNRVAINSETVKILKVSIDKELRRKLRKARIKKK
jgi:tRNA(Ile)-lysidine synthase